mmetsp:Transcript_71565/g.152966  ORF Transcript_71565/g.152966 Transcript_71565/m.152966 type:complete len:222 (-) Transcript_71565:110-775(-)
MVLREYDLQRVLLLQGVCEHLGVALLAVHADDPVAHLHTEVLVLFVPSLHLAARLDAIHLQGERLLHVDHFQPELGLALLNRNRELRRALHAELVLLHAGGFEHREDFLLVPLDAVDPDDAVASPNHVGLLFLVQVVIVDSPIFDLDDEGGQQVHGVEEQSHRLSLRVGHDSAEAQGGGLALEQVHVGVDHLWLILLHLHNLLLVLLLHNCVLSRDCLHGS